MAYFFKSFLFISILFALTVNSSANPPEFNAWLTDFKIKAHNIGISKKTISNTLNDVRFLPKVIEYDRYQPEFYEDTSTYIGKRVTKLKIKQAKFLYSKEETKINEVEKVFNVEKELLLSLMGIETNFGKYLGKMDIVSSLSTLSFDKRRSAFFTNELLTLLKLVDQKKIDPNVLYGSWAGAFGNFQFMPSTINNYAIDYDNDLSIELKEIDDSFASAANYINKIGWKKNKPCFYKVKLKDDIPHKYLNTSAKKISNKKKVSFFQQYIKDPVPENFTKNFEVGIITPDKDIIPDANNLSPAYLVYDNYELILKWNRSLRFALAVCTLKNKLKDDI